MFLSVFGRVVCRSGRMRFVGGLCLVRNGAVRGSNAECVCEALT